MEQPPEQPNYLFDIFNITSKLVLFCISNKDTLTYQDVILYLHKLKDLIINKTVKLLSDNNVPTEKINDIKNNYIFKSESYIKTINDNINNLKIKFETSKLQYKKESEIIIPPGYLYKRTMNSQSLYFFHKDTFNIISNIIENFKTTDSDSIVKELIKLNNYFIIQHNKILDDNKPDDHLFFTWYEFKQMINENLKSTINVAQCCLYKYFKRIKIVNNEEFTIINNDNLNINDYHIKYNNKFDYNKLSFNKNIDINIQNKSIFNNKINKENNFKSNNIQFTILNQNMIKNEKNVFNSNSLKITNSNLLILNENVSNLNPNININNNINNNNIINIINDNDSNINNMNLNKKKDKTKRNKKNIFIYKTEDENIKNQIIEKYKENKEKFNDEHFYIKVKKETENKFEYYIFLQTKSQCYNAIKQFNIYEYNFVDIKPKQIKEKLKKLGDIEYF